jgi:Ca-activated chloride channel family protein
MSFIWPPMLLSLALIPAGIALYLVIGRKRRHAVAKAGFGLAKPAKGRLLSLRNGIPALLFVAGLAVLCVALARPQAVVALPREEGTVVLAFDVSGSMAADDLKPTRMDAARAASEAFVKNQPLSVVIGVVAFSDSGLSVQTPTNDQATVLAAINRLAPQKGTSLGQGILASLNTIALAEAGPSVDYYTNRSPEPTATPAPVPAGTHTSAVIVLLTDGENNESPDPLAAAQTAADRGVRIYTIGIGSPGGTTLDLNGFRVHTQLNEALLQQVSKLTGGSYFSADDEQELQAIYDDLDTQLVIKPESIEVTAIFAGAGIAMLLAGGLASLFWLGRLP